MVLELLLQLWKQVLLLKEVLGRVIHVLIYGLTLETEHIEVEKSERGI